MLATSQQHGTSSQFPQVHTTDVGSNMNLSVLFGYASKNKQIWPRGDVNGNLNTGIYHVGMVIPHVDGIKCALS